jgi:two-component system, NarL family, sensor kinase
MDNLSQQVVVIIISSVFLLVVAIGIILLVFIYQKKQQLYAREKEQLKVDFEKQILESKLEIQEQTFKYISQEIHDNIGQVLSLAKLTINTMTANDPQILDEKIDSSKKLVGKAIEDLRNLSRNLNTDYITNLGLNISIENEIRILRNASHYEVEVLTKGNAYRLQNQQELIIFRIFQEILQNIIKHSKATAIVITFYYNPDCFILEISDNGIGFDVSILNENSKTSVGIGVLNMRHRANLISADFTIDSKPANGTVVKIKLPVNLT